MNILTLISKWNFFSPLVVLILFPKPVIEEKNQHFVFQSGECFKNPSSRVSFEHLGHRGIEDTMEELQLQLLVYIVPLLSARQFK